VPDLESLLNRLIQGDVEFVIVGGFAAVAHGVSLPTQDIDVCCQFTPENLLKLQAAIADLHPVHRMVPSRPPLQNLYLDTDWGQLDCLGEILGLGAYEAVAARSISVELSGGRCRILTIDALIRAKEATGANETARRPSSSARSASGNRAERRTRRVHVASWARLWISVAFPTSPEAASRCVRCRG
jgi:hypothetical protein